MSVYHRVLTVLAFSFLTLVVLTIFAPLHAQPTVAGSIDKQYAQGLEHYIAGDYGKADSAWREAAKQKHAIAMFNLGLLNERRQVDGASSEAAERWMKLAAEHGYFPAYYHLAVSRPSGKVSSSQMLTWLRSAADAGYTPAIEKLKKLRASTKILANNAGSSNLSKVDTEGGDKADHVWIKRQNAQSWTIQMLAFADRQQVDSFIKAHQLQGKAKILIESNNERVLYKLIYGVYDSRDLAINARDSLSPTLKQHKPWVRTFGSIHSVL